MNDKLDAVRHSLLLIPAFLATLGCHTSLASQASGEPGDPLQSTDRFDLVVYGVDLDRAEHEVFLRTNLDFGSEWVSLGTLGDTASRSDETWTAVVFFDLSTERFLGQDFRESYLHLRIITRDGAPGSRVSAFYATPHVDRSLVRPQQLQRLIEDDPLAVERTSLASHVQPKPAELQPGVHYIEYIRAPMKHTKPGVMEVKQLQVEWRNRDG